MEEIVSNDSLRERIVRENRKLNNRYRFGSNIGNYFLVVMIALCFVLNSYPSSILYALFFILAWLILLPVYRFLTSEMRERARAIKEEKYMLKRDVFLFSELRDANDHDIEKGTRFVEWMYFRDTRLVFCKRMSLKEGQEVILQIAYLEKSKSEVILNVFPVDA
jgi:hypothetical protein